MARTSNTSFAPSALVSFRLDLESEFKGLRLDAGQAAKGQLIELTLLNPVFNAYSSTMSRIDTASETSCIMLPSGLRSFAALRMTL